MSIHNTNCIDTDEAGCGVYRHVCRHVQRHVHADVYRHVCTSVHMHVPKCVCAHRTNCIDIYETSCNAMSTHMFVHMRVHMSMCISAYMSMHTSAHMSIHLSVDVSIDNARFAWTSARQAVTAGRHGRAPCRSTPSHRPSAVELCVDMCIGHVHRCVHGHVGRHGLQASYHHGQDCGHAYRRVYKHGYRYLSYVL